MGGWKKWAGFVIWCVLLFGGMIAAGTDLWPLGVAAVVAGAVGLVLWSRRYATVFVCPSCGAELSGQDFRSSRWSPDGTDALPQLWSDASRRGMPQKRAVKKCPVHRALFL